MRRLLSFSVLFVFWLVITGSLRPFDLIAGVILAALLSTWAATSLWPDEREPLSVRAWLRLPGYMLYLLKEIVVAALYVAERVLDPKMPIAPTLFTHRVHFESDTARVALANSITLTPGTLTVDVQGDTFIIHCLHASFSDGISSGDFERRVASTFEV